MATSGVPDFTVPTEVKAGSVDATISGTVTIVPESGATFTVGGSLDANITNANLTITPQAGSVIEVVNGGTPLIAQPGSVLLATVSFAASGAATGSFQLPSYVHSLRLVNGSAGNCTVTLTGHTSGYRYATNVGVSAGAAIVNIPIAPSVDTQIDYTVTSSNATAGTLYAQGTSDPSEVGIVNAPGSSVSIIALRGDGRPFPQGESPQYNTVTASGAFTVCTPPAGLACLVSAGWVAVRSTASGTVQITLTGTKNGAQVTFGYAYTQPSGSPPPTQLNLPFGGMLFDTDKPVTGSLAGAGIGTGLYFLAVDFV